MYVYFKNIDLQGPVCGLIRLRIRIRLTKNDRIRPDPYPQHCWDPQNKVANQNVKFRNVRKPKYRIQARRYLSNNSTSCRTGPPALLAENTCTVTTNKVKQSTNTVHRIENMNFCHWSDLINDNTRIITGLP